MSNRHTSVTGRASRVRHDAEHGEDRVHEVADDRLGAGAAGGVGTRVRGRGGVAGGRRVRLRLRLGDQPSFFGGCALMNADSRSIGTGKIVVLLFSAAISVSVWR